MLRYQQPGDVSVLPRLLLVYVRSVKRERERKKKRVKYPEEKKKKKIESKIERKISRKLMVSQTFALFCSI